MLFITLNQETALSEEAEGVSSWSKCHFLVAAPGAALEEQFQSGQDETQADRGSLAPTLLPQSASTLGSLGLFAATALRE